MNEFPQPYEKETLTEMYSKLNLSKEQLLLLFDYFDALSNFYNIISLKDAFGIISRQNQNIISKEAFVEFVSIARHDHGHYYYIIAQDELYDDVPAGDLWGMEIVHESLVAFDIEDYDSLKENQAGIPLYIPSKNKLLKYKDDLYFPWTPQTEAMSDFFCREMGMSKNEAYDVTAECSLLISISDVEDPFTDIYDDFERMRVYFNNSQLMKLHPLLCDLYLHTNMPRLRGFTPIEYEKHTGNSDRAAEIVRQSRLQNDLGQAATAPKKVGRNDPCPCGSGKKYKKCCGKQS